jgi:hypothetical protein
MTTAPDIFIALKDKAAFCERLGLPAEALAAVRHLRATDPSLTLELLQGFNRIAFYPAETAAELNEILSGLWSESSR